MKGHMSIVKKQENNRLVHVEQQGKRYYIEFDALENGNIVSRGSYTTPDGSLIKLAKIITGYLNLNLLPADLERKVKANDNTTRS